MRGKCRYGERCKYSHESKPTSKAPPRELCPYLGTPRGCFKGQQCKFSHETVAGSWEKVILRRRYLKALRDAGKDQNGIPLTHEILSDDDIKLKRVFTEFLYDMESRWGGTRHWMPKLRSKRIDQIDGLAMSFGL